MTEPSAKAQPSDIIMPCRCSGAMPAPLTYTMSASTGERWYQIKCSQPDCTGNVSARNPQVCRDEWNGMQMGDATDVSACTYDNPATMSRECWQDGRLICSYKAELLMSHEPIPASQFFFGANVGDWLPGRLLGEVQAIAEDMRPEVEVCDPENLD